MTLEIDRPVAPTLAPVATWPKQSHDREEMLRCLEGAEITRVLVDDLVLGALTRVRDLSRPVPGVDWLGIWCAGENAPSLERRLGRIALAAKEVADRLDALCVEEYASVRPHAPVTPPRFLTQPRILIPLPPAPVTGAEVQLDASAATVKVAAPARRTGRVLGVFSWLRNIGLLIVLFVGWQLWGTALLQHPAQQALGREFAAKVRAAAGDTTAKTASSSTTSRPAVLLASTPRSLPAGSLVGRIQIPAIGLSQYIVEGVGEAQLARGPGHYPGTALPGYVGNVAIAGHRTTYGAPFNRLAEVHRGDLVYLTTSSGVRLTYSVVRQPYPVAPNDVEVLDDFSDDRVTLTTCTPEFSAAQRLVLVAELDETVRTAKAPAVKATTAAATSAAMQRLRLADTQESGWGLSMLPLLLVVTSLLIAMGLCYPRLSRRLGRIRAMVLAAVPFAVVVLVLFSVVERVLPPNL
jgi:sortase A